MNVMNLDMQSYCAKKLLTKNSIMLRSKLKKIGMQQLQQHNKQITIPVTPTFPNPGRFIFGQWLDWQGKRDWKNIAWAKSQCILTSTKEIFNESIWVDLNKETTIGSSSLLRNQHWVWAAIRIHLEGKFNKLRLVDIQAIMNK